MQRISEIGTPDMEQAQQCSDSVTLTMRSGPQLPVATGLALGRLMAETQARYPNQELPPGTPDMHLTLWEELVLEHGLQRFTEGLKLAIRQSRFIPDPLDIGAQCKLLALAAQPARVEIPEFVPCGRCFDGLCYVDANGQPCDVSQSKDRVMRACACKVAWREAKRRAMESRDGGQHAVAA